MTTTETVETTTQTEESRFFVIRTVKKAADACADKVKAYNEKYVSKYLDSGRDFLKDREKDARKVYDNMIEKGKEYVEKGREYKDKVPMAGKIEERISGAYRSVKEKINLPAREDIEKLTAAMDTLNARVDELNKK